MPWLELNTIVKKEAADIFSDTLTELGALSVTFKDAEDQPVLEPGPGQTPLWDTVQVLALFPAEFDQLILSAELQNIYPDTPLSNYHFNFIEDQDWERMWMNDFHPMHFGKRLWICPSNATPPDDNAVNVILDPGLAFGTGTHPTTAMCLRWLDEVVQGGETVMDFGCGSGILAIAALKLGCRHAIAVDNDPQALQATVDNAERNGIDLSRLTICSPSEVPAVKVNLFLANILAKPLIELASRFKNYCEAGTQLALSGILKDQAQDVSDAYLSFCQLNNPHYEEDWVRLDGRVFSE